MNPPPTAQQLYLLLERWYNNKILTKGSSHRLEMVLHCLAPTPPWLLSIIWTNTLYSEFFLFNLIQVIVLTSTTMLGNIHEILSDNTFLYQHCSDQWDWTLVIQQFIVLSSLSHPLTIFFGVVNKIKWMYHDYMIITSIWYVGHGIIKHLPLMSSKIRSNNSTPAAMLITRAVCPLFCKKNIIDQEYLDCGQYSMSGMEGA